MFIAHKNDIPPGIKKPLLNFKKLKSLSNNFGEYKLFNNICPHQGSMILTSDHNRFSCRYHGWEWDDDGCPIGNGNTKACNNSKLVSSDLFLENSLLFSEKINLNHIKNIDLSYMQLVEERIDHVSSNYMNIVDVFLDVDHIPVVHEGVYDKIGITGNNNVNWIFEENYSLQLVEKNSTYSEEFRNTLLNIDEENEYGAFWLCVYPSTMIEWQPGSLFITHCLPEEKNTDVCVFKYRDQRYSDENWNLNDEIWETAWFQDREQSESIPRTIIKNSYLEESKIKFRDYLNLKNL